MRSVRAADVVVEFDIIPPPVLDRLRVHRVDAFSDNRLRFTVPPELTLTGPRDVRAVAEAVCAPPPTPAGTFSCPGDLGVVQHLIFSAGRHTVPQVTVSTSGCATVRGAGPPRRQPEPVWTALGKALHLAPPYEPAFAGSLAMPA